MLEIIAHWIQTIPTNSACWLLVTLFIVLDVALGTLKAYLNKSISSEIARKGVMHKIGFFGSLLLCNLIDLAQGIAPIKDALGIQIPTSVVCACMIILCEIMSIYENIREMNPNVDLEFLNKEKDEEKEKRE